MLAGFRRQDAGSVLAFFALLCILPSLLVQGQPRSASDMELPLSAEQTAEAIGARQLYDRLRTKSWVDMKRIPDPKTPAGEKKVEKLVSLPGMKIQQTISDLDDRQSMLYDLRVRLSYMKLDLTILLASLANVKASGINPDANLITASHAAEAH